MKSSSQKEDKELTCELEASTESIITQQKMTFNALKFSFWYFEKVTDVPFEAVPTFLYFLSFFSICNFFVSLQQSLRAMGQWQEDTGKEEFLGSPVVRTQRFHCSG